MSRIVKISEDNYRLKVKSGGNIIFDTSNDAGDPTGKITIIGDLDVKGVTTTVESSVTTIKDNILVLNDGQTGNGISSALYGQAGIDIDRGSLPHAMFLFDENVTHYDPYTSTAAWTGTFVLKTNDNRLSGLQLTTITNDGTHNLQFDLHNSVSNVLTLVNVDATTYSQLVFGTDAYPSSPPALTPEDNFLVTKRYVKEYIASGAVEGGMADVDKIHFGSTNANRVQAYSASIEFYIGNSKRADITAGGLDVDNINLYQNTITNTSVNNLILTASTNFVEVNAVLELDDQSAFQTVLSGKSKLYSRSSRTALNQNTGRTGLYVSNNTTAQSKIWDPDTTSYITGTDELVAKNRALLFSMLF